MIIRGQLLPFLAALVHLLALHYGHSRHSYKRAPG